MSTFEFREKNFLDSLSEKFKYFSRVSQTTSPAIQEAVSKIKRDGFVLLEGHLSGEKLELLQRATEEYITQGKIKYPSLAQSKIDPVTHRKLIENFLLGTGEDYKKHGIAFEQDEFKSYPQALSDFKPSTMEFLIPRNRLEFFQAWLDPFLLSIVRSYMGYTPYLLEAYVRRNFPSPYRTMNHFWHRDLNDKFLLLKGFIFLTDCNLESGPHEYVLGSHRDFRLNGKRYYSDEEVDTTYPMDSGKVVRSTVKAGTVLLEDTRGLHRAALPLKAHRDLGYAVFMPLPWFKDYRFINYQIDRTTYDKLSPLQRSFIPKNFIS